MLGLNIEINVNFANISLWNKSNSIEVGEAIGITVDCVVPPFSPPTIYLLPILANVNILLIIMTCHFFGYMSKNQDLSKCL